MKDDVLGQAAQLSFYFLLSIFPLLLFVASLLGLFLQSDQILHEALRTWLKKMTPESAFQVLDQTLTQITQGSSGGKLSLGLVFSLWTASSGMLAVIQGLNIAYEVKDYRPWWKRGLLALALTIVFALLILLALLLFIYGPHLIDLLSRVGWEAGLGTLWRVVQWLLVIGFVLLAFNILYIFAPNVRRHRWHWLMPGTVVGVLLWLLASFGFKVYLSFFNTYTATYGSIGAVILLLLWLYLTGLALLVGGEVNSVLEKAARQVEEKR